MDVNIFFVFFATYYLAKNNFVHSFQKFGKYEYYLSTKVTDYYRKYAEAKLQCNRMNATLAKLNKKEIGEFLKKEIGSSIGKYIGYPKYLICDDYAVSFSLPTWVHKSTIFVNLVLPYEFD